MSILQCRKKEEENTMNMQMLHTHPLFSSTIPMMEKSANKPGDQP